MVARTLVVMVKEPRAGAVKTRLGRGIGAATAAGFYRQMVSATFRAVAGDPRWTTILAVSPDTAVVGPTWPMTIPRIPQGRGSLGDRMDRIMQSLPPGPVIIIGTDIPSIRADDIAAAFRQLGSSDAVFGPSPDGGYWLVGLKRHPVIPRIFENVRWSSRWTLEDTLANLAGHRTGFVVERDDIDTVEDLRRHRNPRRGKPR